jgi:hypothetical protein
MKTVVKKIGYVLLALCLPRACSSDDGFESVTLEVSSESVDFLSSGGTQAVTVSASVEWRCAVGEAGSGWCSVTSGGDKLSVSVAENTERDVRETFVDVFAGKLSKRIAVRQLGLTPTILATPDKFPSLPAIGAEIRFTVTANVGVTITGAPDWMSELEVIPQGAAMTTYRYSVAPNPSSAERSDTLTIADTTPNSACSAALIVAQQGRSGSSETGIGSDVKIAIAGAEASSSQGGEGIEKSYDGSYTTMYHSSYGGTTYPITLTYHLANADTLDYFIYHPRSGGSNGLFREVEIQVKYHGSANFIKQRDFDFMGTTGATRVNFEPALENVASVRFIVKSSMSDEGKAFASCSEMEFYKKNAVDFNFLTLFADRSCSELKAGITQAEIDACPNAFFRDIAGYMYRDIYPREFRIEEYRAYPDPSEDAAVNKTNHYSKYDNPTGIAVSEGEELVVLAEGVDDAYPVSIKIQDLDGEEAQANYFDRGASYSISNGVNKFTVANKGLVYVMYFRPDYLTAPKLKLHFATGIVNGYFDVQKHGATAQWTRLLNAASFKFFDVVGKNAHLTFPTSVFREYTRERGVDLINLYDRLVYLEWKFMGLLPEPDGYGNTTHSHVFRNRMYFVVMYTSFMNATSYRTSYHVETLDDLCDPSKMLNEQGGAQDVVWGPAHEVGHINQTRPGFKWHGMTEVTNNLHSIYVQTNLHSNHTPKVNTRLQIESMRGEGGYVNRYEKAMNVYMVQKKAHNYNDKDMDVFCKLVPLWQLHLFLTEVKERMGKGNNSFYADLYQRVREDNTTRTNGEHQLKFVERVCEIAQLNLEEFFTSYGFLTPINITIDDYGTGTVEVTQAQIEATLTNIRKYVKPVGAKEFQYITDENVEIYKSGSGIVAYELREGSEAGDVKRIYLNTGKPEALNVSSISVPSGQKLYAVEVTGKRSLVR